MYRRNRERRYHRRRREYDRGPENFITSAFRRPAAQIGVLIVVGLIIFLILQMGRSGTSTPPSPAEITASEAFTRYQNGAFLLDVRTQEEWNEFHAPNSTLIPLDQLASRLNEVPKDKEIVVVCRSGNRSQEGRDILLQAGFTQVTSMQGGLNDWRASGYPIEP